MGQASGVAVDRRDHVWVVQRPKSLTEDERVVVVLHHLADRRIDEIAEEVGVPVGTVKSRLSRGRAHLAGLMAEPAEPEKWEKSGEPEEVERHA